MVETKTWRRRFVQLLVGIMAVLGLVVVAPAASASPKASPPCASPKVVNAKTYCLVNVEDLTSTRFGVGQRVYLRANVEEVTASTVTLSQVRLTNPCVPGNYCGQTLIVSFVTLRVSWSAHQPPIGYLVNAFGTTKTGSLTPVGYSKSSYCGPWWELCL